MVGNTEKPEFESIGVRCETKDALEALKGRGKTWDRYIRELANLPLEAHA
jgi:hypothetical protein